MMQAPKAPSAPNAPIAAPARITITGGGPSAIYQATRAQRQELVDQMQNLQQQRSDLLGQLQQLPSGSPGAPGRPGLEQRITAIDARIANLDKQIADADAQVANVAAIPGAVIAPGHPVDRQMPEDMFVLSVLVIFAVFFPMSIAMARRIWKRSSTAVAQFPKEIVERLARLEQSADATALEVERIGEGQRFLTRLFTEGSAAPAALSAPRQQDRQS